MNLNDPVITSVSVVKLEDDEALALAYHADQTTRVAQRLLGLLYGSGDCESGPSTPICAA